MKRTYIFIITVIIAVMGALAACHENIIDETDSSVENKLITVEGTLNLPLEDTSLYNDYNILSIGGIANIDDGKFEVDAYLNDKVQTFIVEHNNEVYLMSRTPLSNGQSIELSVQSTAIAMVTMHPLFSPVGRDDYDALTNSIMESPKYQDFYDKVAKSISNKRHLYDESNEDMLIAFSNLMEELCGETEDNGNYDDFLDEIENAGTRSINTRAVYQHSQINPTYIDAQINGNTLSLRTIWATPSYYGTVSQPNGQVVNKVIYSRDDYGIMDLSTRGKPMEYTFSDEGSYRFNFSRVNAEATLDFYMRITSNILSTLGLNITGSDYDAVALAKAVSNAITIAGSGVTASIIDGKMSGEEWLKIAGSVILDELKNYLSWNGNWDALGKLGKVINGSLNWYNKIKGAANLGLRLAYAFDAPESINFCLCYYDNEVTTCTEASLYKVDGDEQIGYAKQRLLLPLTVYVQTIGDDEMYYESSSYHRIKFEVISGGGEVEFDLVSADNNNQASTYWTLGEEGEQKVKATVVDIITDKEISEPVYFTADLNSAEITIRLDWSKHSCDTDIDLHVFDPFGEEIAYYNMTSSSGGYLDRDDVVGPGPEHVRWTSAPAGEYKIYVHYFPNEAEDRSVTSYKVSVYADGITYQPKTGSIAYDQMVPVGKFSIGESSTTRSISTPTLGDTAPIDKKIFPKKK